MNLRQQKRYLLGMMAYNKYWAWGSAAAIARSPLVAAFAAETAMHRVRLTELVETPAEEAKQEFACVKVKDGSVVDTFDTLAEAQDLVEKHARQKKAKLQVMDTVTGELVLFEAAAA